MLVTSSVWFVGLTIIVLQLVDLSNCASPITTTRTTPRRVTTTTTTTTTPAPTTPPNVPGCDISAFAGIHAAGAFNAGRYVDVNSCLTQCATSINNCLAVDIDFTVQKSTGMVDCWVHIVAADLNQLYWNVNTVHYRMECKNQACNGGKWDVYQNQNSLYGDRQLPSDLTSDVCQGLCINDPKCLSIDYSVTAIDKCYLHKDAGFTSTRAYNYGVDQWVLRRCGSNAVETACQKMRDLQTSESTGGSGSGSGFVVNCLDTGEFNPQQCDQHTRCWCVDQNGQEIAGSDPNNCGCVVDFQSWGYADTQTPLAAHIVINAHMALNEDRPANYDDAAQASMRGIHTVILDPTQCTTSDHQQFDVSGSSADNMVTYIDGLSDQTILLGISVDDPLSTMSDQYDAYMRAAGVPAQDAGFRGKLAFVLEKGRPDISWFQKLSSGGQTLQASVTIMQATDGTGDVVVTTVTSNSEGM